jgi:hypothetical protein
MTPLGKPLIFYLKYPAEMARLYGQPKLSGNDLPDTTGLQDAEQVLKAVRAVGDAAWLEAASLVSSCMDAVQSRLHGSGSLTWNRTSQAWMKPWSHWRGVKVASVKRRLFVGVELSTALEVGAKLPEGAIGALIPCLRHKAGLTAETLMLGVLSGRTQRRDSIGSVYKRGTVVLPYVPILPADGSGSDVDRDSLLGAVVERFATLRPEELEMIVRRLSKAGGEDDPDDEDKS